MFLRLPFCPALWLHTGYVRKWDTMDAKERKQRIPLLPLLVELSTAIAVVNVYPFLSQGQNIGNLVIHPAKRSASAVLQSRAIRLLSV